MDNFYRVENIGDDGRVDVFFSYGDETYRDYFYADDVTNKGAITSAIMEKYKAFKADIDSRVAIPANVSSLIDKEIAI